MNYSNEQGNKDRTEEGINEKNMSEAELAELIGVKRPYLNAISCGKKNVTVSQLERIAEALGMTLHICFDDPD